MLPRSAQKTDSPHPSWVGGSDARYRKKPFGERSQEASGEILGMPLEQFMLSRRVEELNEELWHARRSNVTDFVALIGKIQELSRRLFPGPVTIDYACDPEDATNEYIVFDVVARGEFADYKSIFFQWHDEVAKLYPGTLSEFRLIVHSKA